MQDQWQPELYYHVIGKAIPGETLFRDEEDMTYFLRHVLRFKLYHFLDILVYCLCGNHFHLAVRTRSVAATQAKLRGKPARVRSAADEEMLAGTLDFARYVHRALAGALSGYVRHYNSTYKRSGQLLILPTLHGLTDKGAPGELLSRRLCAYVGLNFVKHRIAGVGEKYFGSSLTNPLFKIVDQPALLAEFGGQQAYLDFHNNYLRRYGAAMMALDEADFYAALQPRYFDKARFEWVEGAWEA